MRKIMSLVLVLTLAFSMAAYAQMGMGRGMGRAGTQQTSVANVEEAKALVLQQASNIKGAKVVSALEGQGRRGTMYIINVSDDNGKTYEYHVNPWGEVILFR